jgi:hypothetical protein
MATDQYEDDIDLDDAIVDEDDGIDLEILDDDAEVDDYADDFDDADAVVDGSAVEDESEEEEEEEESGAGTAPDVPDASDDDDDDDVVDLDDDDEEEDEETLEVLLGPDSETTATTPRKRSDESGDAPPGEGEFTCRSCFLVKRRPQLADADAMICLDCA